MEYVGLYGGIEWLYTSSEKENETLKDGISFAWESATQESGS